MPGLFTEGDDGMDEKALSLLEQFDRGTFFPIKSPLFLIN
jgi:hypothetical protein